MSHYSDGNSCKLYSIVTHHHTYLGTFDIAAYSASGDLKNLTTKRCE